MSLILPMPEWPEVDRTMWRALFSDGGPLDDRGALVHLRETSRETLANRYGRWLRWLLTTAPETETLSPWDRVTVERLREWCDALEHTTPMTRLMFVDGVLRVVIAAYPAGDWHQQRRLLAYLRRSRGHGTRSRKAGRILSSAALFEAGRALAEDEAPATRSPLFRATTLRDGAIIALLALMPMRRRALANLRIGESVFLSETRISIALPAELTKTGIPWEADVPDAARSILTLYLDEARPLLRARGTGSDPHFWLDRKGKGLRAATLGPGITAQVARMTGIRVPPHFFRDAAATTLARLSPQSARLIPPVLGHSGFATAEKHYVHAQSIDAGRDYAALIARRKELAR